MEWMLMPLRRYAEFSGRSRRKEYWMFTLGCFILYMVLMILGMVIGGASMMAMASGDPGAGAMGLFAGMGIFFLIYMVVALALFIPTLAVTIRRLHDTDRSGWWILLPFGLVILGAVAGSISETLALIFMLGYLVAAIALLVFLFLEGTKGPNKYGEDPKGEASAEVFA